MQNMGAIDSAQLHAADFLQLALPDETWKITHINEGVFRSSNFTIHQRDNAKNFINNLDGQCNLYWSPNPLINWSETKSKRNNIRELRWLHVDIDPKATNSEGINKERAEILSLLENEERLRAAGLPGLPTFVMDSGGGYWGLWKLDQSIPVLGENSYERLIHAIDLGLYNRFLAEQLNGVLSRGFADGCHNIDRICRLPFTMNLPKGDKVAKGRVPRRATLIYSDFSRTYPLSAFTKSTFEEHIPASEADEAKAFDNIGEIADRFLKESDDPWEITREIARQYPQIGEKTLGLLCLGRYEEDENQDLLKKVTRNGTITVDRSSALHRANMAMLHLGIPHNVILSILCDPRLPISEHIWYPEGGDKQRPGAGARRTPSAAIQFMKRQIAKNVAKTLKTQEDAALLDGDNVSTKEAPPSQKDNADKTETVPPPKKEKPTPSGVIREMNDKHAVLLQEGGKALILSWEASEIDPTRQTPVLQTFADFGRRYMNRFVEIPKGDETKLVTYSDHWLKNPNRREFLSLRFFPGQPEVVDNYLNMWRGWAMEPVAGNWQLMKDHVLKVLADGNQAYADYILNWAAWAVQNPEFPAESALVFKGKPGTGKGIFARTLKKLFGQHGLQITSPTHLTGNFNSHLRDCCLLFADEAIVPGEKKAESVLKGLITEPEIPIERKRIDLVAARNHLHIIMASNEEWVVPAGMDDRRFAVFNVSDAHKQDHVYFRALAQQMEEGGYAAMLHELLNRDIGDWHPRQNIPQTEALREQKELSLNAFDSCILAILEEAELPGSTPTIGEHPNIVYSRDTPRALGLYSQIRLISPKLKNWSEHKLGKCLREWGCERWTNGSKRGWEFPSLTEMRKMWDERYWQHEWSAVTDWGCANEASMNTDEIPF